MKNWPINIEKCKSIKKAHFNEKTNIQIIFVGVDTWFYDSVEKRDEEFEEIMKQCALQL